MNSTGAECHTIEMIFFTVPEMKLGYVIGMDVKILVLEENAWISCLKSMGFEVHMPASWHHYTFKSNEIFFTTCCLCQNPITDWFNHFPDLKGIVLTHCFTPMQLAYASKIGVRAFLPPSISSQQLAMSIHMVAQGYTLLPTQVLQDAIPVPLRISLPVSFTPTERCVLNLLADGKSNRDMADDCNVSVNTIKTHLRHIYRKIEAQDRTQAAIWAVRHGFGEKKRQQYHPLG